MRESCGVIGIAQKENSAKNIKDFFVHKKMGTVDIAFSKRKIKDFGDIGEKIVLGLKELQHRGQESSGIAVSGNAGIGHNRYSVTGDSSRLNVQPISGRFHGENFALGHNGNLINTIELRKKAEAQGFNFSNLIPGQKPEEEISDTWVIAALIETSSQQNFISALFDVLPMLQGAFSLVVLYEDCIIGIRDRFGIRPLCFGEGDDCFVLASESRAIDSLGATIVRDVAPGEFLLINKDGKFSFFWASNLETKLKICIFEYIYFAMPDSIIEGVPVYLARKNMGRSLAAEHHDFICGGGIIVPVKDSGTLGAIGVREETGFNFDSEVLLRPHFTYVKPRTFIEPKQILREKAVWMKFRPILFDIQGSTVILVDDSIVRATTIARIVKLLKTSKVILQNTIEGAGKIKVLITSPPYMFPCFYGIDTWRYADKGELCAKNFNGDIGKIREHIGADYLGYLSLENTIKAIIDAGLPGCQLKPYNFCAACFSGEYPVPVKS